MKLYCCQCKTDVEPRLTNGGETYPHRDDLADLPFWKCDACGNYVGCHYKTADRTRPLGNIPTGALKNARQHIHRILDPLWKERRVPRGKLYAQISSAIGHEYHTAEIKTIEEARMIYSVVQNICRQHAP